MTPHMITGTLGESAVESPCDGFAASKECVRCGGLMVPSRFIDMLDDTGQLEFVGERCIQCGDVVDPIIRHNRVRQAVTVRQAPQELSRVA